MEPEGVEPSRRGVQGRPVARNTIPGASLSADGESRTPTGLLPHGSEPRLSTGSKHVRKLSRVGRPGIEPGSPGLQPGAWTVLSYRSMRGQGGTRTRVSEVAARQMRRSPTWPRRFRERDSNPTHLWGQSPASFRLDDPGASKNRCLHALAHSSSSLSVVGAGPRGLSLPLGLRLPTGLDRARPPHALRHCASPPQQRQGSPG